MSVGFEAAPIVMLVARHGAGAGRVRPREGRGCDRAAWRTHCRSCGVPRPRHFALPARRPQASPLYRVLADHFEALGRVHEERFEPAHGPLRAAARRAAARFLDAGAYATRRRVWWRRRGVELVASAPVVTSPSEPAGDWPALKARRRRWAELLRLVFRVEVEVCPRCGSAARIVAFITEPAV